MKLTREESKRAISLQRKLKLVRAWKSLGRLFTWPWTLFDKAEKKWRDELMIYYNKKYIDKPKQPMVGKPITRAEYDECMQTIDRFARALNGWTS